MKGTVYSGIVYMPHHPEADLHGQLRCVVRAQGITNLTSILRAWDIPFSPVLFNYSLWTESKSAIEREVSEGHFGEALVCPTWAQYLRHERYQPIPLELKMRPAKSRMPAERPKIGQHLFAKWDELAGPKRECQHCSMPKGDKIHVGTGA